MHVSDIITSPWAIIPEKLLEIRAVYSAHVNGEKIDLAAVEARLGKPLANDQQGYSVTNGVAIVPVHGVLGKRMNMFSQISGGSSYQLVERDIKAAVADPNVNSILLHIDSPGGAVDGVQTLADVVREAGSIKPVMTFADGLMASAAYWIGSAASEIVASSATAQIGSIGVVTTHTDSSKAQEQAGYKTTEISAGKYKRIASQYKPLTEEGAAHLQEQVDQLYTIFVDAVAQNRGATPDQVLTDMADGRVFLAQEAERRNMIDHIASLETTIFNMSTGVWPMTKNVTATQAPQAQAAAEITMDVQTLKEKFPDIAQALMKEGADQERARIQSCEENCLAGHEAIVAAMKYDGKSTGQDVAMTIVQAEKKLRTNHLEALHANAPKPVPAAPVPAVETNVADDKSKPIEERAKAKWDADANLQAEFGNDYNAYLAYARAEDGGKVKVLGGRK